VRDLPEKRRAGRPQKEIDYALLDKLCQYMCTGEECAAILGISFDTLSRGLIRDGHEGFAEYRERASAPAKMSLRRAQFKSALGGNVTMQIWLGKVYLGQREPERVPQGDDMAELLRQALKVKEEPE